ncbi:hypothetical protein MTO96_029725 [Rhipicephalus appendiculatus]
MSRLLAVRPVHNLQDTERLRTLYDELQTGVRSLEALGVASSTYGVLLLTVLGKSFLDYDSLSTVLTQAEAAVNSRPLTFVSSDAGELMPSSPAHFLVGRKLTSLPPLRDTTEVKSAADSQIRRWKQRSTLVDSFWRRWRLEYLLQLRSAHVIKPGKGRSINEGDIVLLGDDRAHRQMWKLCRVLELSRCFPPIWRSGNFPRKRRPNTRLPNKESFDDRYNPCTRLSSTTNQLPWDEDDQE